MLLAGDGGGGMSGFSTTDSLAGAFELSAPEFKEDELRLSEPVGGNGGARRTNGGGPGTMRKRQVSVQLQADP